MDQFLDQQIEKFSQARYDFNIEALSRDEVLYLKKLAKEKRSDYGIAPISTDIFRYISEKESSVFFEYETFDNKDLDALIYLPNPKQDITFIILNSSQPLMNQIFATAHEYYHYIKDLDLIRLSPRVCSLSDLKEKNEQKASRFAAEFLLPEEALKTQVNLLLDHVKKNDFKNADFKDTIVLCCSLTIHYGIPLKAVLFRLLEEGYINDITNYLSNYEFMKQTFQQTLTTWSKQSKELLDSGNPYLEEILYNLIPRAYNSGYVSLGQIKADMEKLKLNNSLFSQLIETEDTVDDDDDLSDDLRARLLSKLGRKNDA